MESAIDAISLRILGDKRQIISTGGGLTAAQIYYIRSLNKKSIIAAFDSDEAGEYYSEKLKAAMPGVYRLSPNLKDWNDVLMARQKWI